MTDLLKFTQTDLKSEILAKKEMQKGFFNFFFNFWLENPQFNLYFLKNYQFSLKLVRIMNRLPK